MFKSVIIASLVTALAISGTAMAQPPHGEKAPKPAILITSFGTSMSEARPAIDNLVTAAKTAFPDVEVRLAFTSNIIRRKLAGEGVKDVPPTPVQALADLNDEGYSDVLVMPTHIIPGAEHDDIAGVVNAFRSIRGKYGFRSLRMGKAFLSSVEGCDEMADILIKRFANVAEGTGVVLMGHGTPHHIANAMYSQLQVALNKKADGRFFIGTVENTPLIEDVVVALKKAGIKKVVISPLMEVAGDHANNDLAGADDPESWLNILKGEGFEVETYIYGLGADPNIAAAFVEHIKAAIGPCPIKK